MSYSQNQARLRSRAPLASVPPVMIEETGWDIVLALRTDQRGELSLAKLASIVSVPQRVLGEWLARLEDRKLITGTAHPSTGELRAVLTPAGRALLDRYLSAATDIQLRALN
jgi:DNA-binding MarR family transcriptional regulator